MVSLKSGKVRDSGHQILGQSVTSNYQDFVRQKQLQEQAPQHPGNLLVSTKSALAGRLRSAPHRGAGLAWLMWQRFVQII